MTNTPFQMKYKNLQEVVDGLQNASKMHKKQSEIIEDHIADMEGESPAKLTKTPVGPRAEKIEPKKETYKVPTDFDDEGFDTRKINPGYEDPIKIQHLHTKGLTPGSQEFVKKVKENVKSKNYVESSDLEKNDDDR